jgi:hypothetical protein
MDQLRENLGAVDLRLEDAEKLALEKVSAWS